MATNAEPADAFPQTGLIGLPRDTPEFQGPLGKLAQDITDDVFQNIIFDLLLETHREEKIRRASSAAVMVEQKAALLGANTGDDAPLGDTEHPQEPVETDGANFTNGVVFIRGNPLKTTPEILCPKCGKPRLLYPSDGKGAKAPEPGVDYCKIRPFINKEGCDVFGQVYQAPGPGRGHKKEKNLKLPGKESTPNGSQDSPHGSPPPETLTVIQFPHSKCLSCEKFFPIKRMNGHMAKCIGGTGRDASRSALNKIQNSNSNNNNGYNSSGSRNGTPAPSQSSSQRKSPNKRTASDDIDSEENGSAMKKKKPNSAMIKKSNQLKSVKMKKSASQISGSNLSFVENRPSDDDDDYNMDDGDDARDGTFGRKEAKGAGGTIKVDGGSGTKLKLKTGKLGKAAATAKPQKKWLHRDKDKDRILPKAVPKPKIEVAIYAGGGGKETDESSQTMSSPNGE